MRWIKWVLLLCLPFFLFLMLIAGAISYTTQKLQVGNAEKIGSSDDMTCVYNPENIKFDERTEKVRQQVIKSVDKFYVNMVLGIYEVDTKSNIKDVIKKTNDIIKVAKDEDIPTLIQTYKYGLDYLKYLKENNKKHNLSMSRKYFEWKYPKSDDTSIYMFYIDVLQKTNKDCKNIEVSGEWIPPLKKPFIISQDFHGLHRGIDVVKPYGDTLYAVTNGIILNVGSSCEGNGGYLGNYCPYGAFSGAGNFVEIKTTTKDKKDIFIYYFHMEKPSVKQGDVVKVGQAIGTIGNSGNSTGTHVHLELRKKEGLVWKPNGDEINPHTLINFY